MTEKLSAEEIKNLHLNDKIELFWSQEKHKYITQKGVVPNVTPVGSPGLILSHYTAKYKSAGGDMFSEVNSKYDSSILLGNQPVDATHYCLGPANKSIELQWENKTMSLSIQFFKQE